MWEYNAQKLFEVVAHPSRPHITEKFGSFECTHRRWLSITVKEQASKVQIGQKAAIVQICGTTHACARKTSHHFPCTWAACFAGAYVWLLAVCAWFERSSSLLSHNSYSLDGSVTEMATLQTEDSGELETRKPAVHADMSQPCCGNKWNFRIDFVKLLKV